MYYLLRECFTRGLRVFDFGLGNEPYKFDWTDTQCRLTTFVEPSLMGRLFRVIFALRSQVRDLVKKAGIGKSA